MPLIPDVIIDDIQSRAEFFQVLADALRQVKTYRAKNPSFWVYQNIEKQLEFIQQAIDGGRTPTSDERRRIDMGLVVSRELEPAMDNDLDDFCKRVTGLAYYFELWQ